MKSIAWLNNFAEEFAKGYEMKKTASVKKGEDVIVDREDVNAKVGEIINFNGKLYKVADLDFEDEKGPGAVLTEVEEVAVEESTIPTQESLAPTAPSTPTTDPMAMAMGTTDIPAAGEASQEYARTNPGDTYDNPGIVQEEINKFNSEATETANAIATENSVDRSVVEQHYAVTENAGAGLAEISLPTENEIQTEEVIVEEGTEEIAPTEIPTEDPIETPVENEEEIKEDEVVVEEEDTLETDKTEEVEEPFSELATMANFKNNRILRRIMSSRE